MLRHLESHLKSNGYDSDHTDAIRDYTESSVTLNIPRLYGLPSTHDDIDSHYRLAESSFGSPHKFHVYTGSQVNLGKMAQASKDGVLHLPAHLSTSLDNHVASGFGDYVSKIHIKPNDKILPAFGHGLHENEKEIILPAGTRIKHINPRESEQGHTPEFEIHSVQHPTHEELQGSNKNIAAFLSKLKPSKPKEIYAATQYLEDKYPKTDAFKTATAGELSNFKDSLVNFQSVHDYNGENHVRVHQSLMKHPKYDFDNAIHGEQSDALTGALLSNNEALKKMDKDTQKDILAKHPHLSYFALHKENLHPDIYDQEVDKIAQNGRNAQIAINSPHMKPHHIAKIVQKLSPSDMLGIPSNENFGTVLSSSTPRQKAKIAERFQDYSNDEDFKQSFFSKNPLDHLLSSEHFDTSKNHLDIFGATNRDTLRTHILHNSPHINEIAAKHPEVLKRTDDLSLNPHLSKKTQDKTLEHVMQDKNGNHNLFIRSLPKEKHDEFLSNPSTPQHVIDSTLRSTSPEEWSSENHSRAMKLANAGDLNVQKRILRDRTYHMKSVTSAHLLDVHNKITNNGHYLTHDLYSHPSFSAEDLHKVLDDFHGSHPNKKNHIVNSLMENPNLQPSHIDRITNGFDSELTAHLKHPNATGDNIVKYMTRPRSNVSKPELEAVTENIDKLTPENIGTLLNHASKTKNNSLAREVLKSKNVSGDVLAAVAHNTDFSNIIAEHPNTPASVLHSFANDQYKGARIQAIANMRLGHRTDAHHLDHNFLKNVLRYGQVTEADKAKITEYAKSRNDSFQELASHPAFSSDMMHDAIREGIDLSNIRNNPNLTPEHTETAFKNLYSNADIFEHLPPGRHLKKFQGTSGEWRAIAKNPHLKADHIEQLHKDQEYMHSTVFSHPSMPPELRKNIIDGFKKDGIENDQVRAAYTDKNLHSSELEAVSKFHRLKDGNRMSVSLMDTLSNHPNANPRTLHNLIRLGSYNTPDDLSVKAYTLKH